MKTKLVKIDFTNNWYDRIKESKGYLCQVRKIGERDSMLTIITAVQEYPTGEKLYIDKWGRRFKEATPLNDTFIEKHIYRQEEHTQD